MRIAIIAASLALSACATHPQQATSLDRSLDALVGQPVELALARLGEPIGSAAVGTDTVYGWGHAFTSSETTIPNPGFIDAAQAQGGVFPPPRRTVHNACVIRVVAGADGRIRSWDYQGTDRACRADAKSSGAG